MNKEDRDALLVICESLKGVIQTVSYIQSWIDALRKRQPIEMEDAARIRIEKAALTEDQVPVILEQSQKALDDIIRRLKAPRRRSKK
jgi:hypothetical protein